MKSPCLLAPLALAAAAELVAAQPSYLDLTIDDVGIAIGDALVSAFNRLSGVKHGLAIGVLNIAEELRRVQIGLINIARRNPKGRVLPIVNWGSRN